MATECLKIAEEVKKYKTVQGLMHHVSKENLIAQHRRQEANKAAGVDGATKITYGQNLNANIDSLVSRMKSFSYRPQPVKRVYIPKAGSSKMRPLGIPAYEDKLVQGVMADILTTVYEPKFLPLSYGFRPGRSCHMAVKALDKTIMTQYVRYVADVDIKGFFDNVNHDWLIRFLEHDIQDKNFIRYIKRFLRSGIMDKGIYSDSDKGTPQGGLVSPILANVYLHYVLDLWFEKVIKQESYGFANMVRYADDFVCCFQKEADAREFLVKLRERLAKFGLEIAADKCRIVKFGRFTKEKGQEFDFLGFTYINATARNGKYTLIHHTSKKKLKAKMQAAKLWLKENMHINVSELISKLNVKLIGHYRYYGISENWRKLTYFNSYVVRQLRKTLARRSQKAYVTNERFRKILQYNPIAKPRIYVSLYR